MAQSLITVSRNWVSVNQQEREAVYQFAHEQFPSICLRRTTQSICRGGLRVRVERFKRDVELDEEHERIIREDWGGDVQEKLVWYQKTFGEAVVKPVPHPDRPGEWLPHVVPWNKYELFFTEASNGLRKYYVTFLDAKYETASDGPGIYTENPGMRIQLNENNIGYPMWNGGTSPLIFVRYHPRTDGSLTSPIAAMRQELLMLKRMMSNEEYASYWGPRPLHAYECVRDFGAASSGANRDAMVTMGAGNFAPGDKARAEEEHKRKKNLEEYIDLQLATRAAKEGRMITVEEKVSFQQSLFMVGQAERPGPQDVNPASMSSPSEHFLSLPVNQHLAAGPSPSNYANFKAMMEVLMPIATATMNLSELILNPGGSTVKGDPELAKQEWGVYVQGEQEQMDKVFQVIYSVAYNDRGRDFINSFYFAWKQELKEVKRNRRILSTKDEEEPFDQVKRMAKKMERREMVDILKGRREQTMRQVVQQNVTVVINHEFHPTVGIEQLQMAFQLGVFDEEYFVQSVGRMMGVPAGNILTQKQRDALKKKRLADQATELDTQLSVKSKYGENPTDGDVSGAFPKKAKKQPSGGS